MVTIGRRGDLAIDDQSPVLWEEAIFSPAQSLNYLVHRHRIRSIQLTQGFGKLLLTLSFRDRGEVPAEGS